MNSTEDGRFAFSELVAQDYLLIVKAAGFLENKVPVTVPQGNITEIRVLMTPVPPPTPYADPFYRFAGALRYAGGAKAGPLSTNHSGIDADAYPEAVRSRRSNVAKYDFVPRSDWQTILVEVEWKATRAEAERLALEVYLPEKLGTGSVGTGKSAFVASGKSPLVWRLDRDVFERMRETTPNLDFSTFVGIQWRIHSAMDSSQAATYALYVEQPFLLYGTIGYNGPLPVEYTRVAPAS